MKISDFTNNSGNSSERLQAKFWLNLLVPNQQGEFVSQSFLAGTPCNDWQAVVKIANRLPILAAALRAKGLSAQVELKAGETLRFKLSSHIGMELRAVGSTEQTLNNTDDLEVELL